MTLGVAARGGASEGPAPSEPVGEPAGAWRYRDKALIFGYAGLAPEKLRQGIAALADAVGEASALASAQYDRT